MASFNVKKANSLINWFGHANAILRKSSRRSKMKNGRSIIKIKK